MSYQLKRKYRWALACGLVGMALLVSAAPAPAQGTAAGAGAGGTSFGSGGFAGATAGGSAGGGSASMSGSASSLSSMFQTPQFGTTQLPGLPGKIPGLVTLQTTTSTGRGGYGGTSTGVSQYNPFVSYYSNPLATGYPSGSSGTSGYGAGAMTFGQPLYTSTTGMIGGTLGTGQITISPVPAGFGANSIGVRRAPAYVTTLGFDRALPAPSVLVADVQAALRRSTRLSGTQGIKIVMIGPEVVLQGWVANPHDARVAGILAHMTPGVREVRNELRVQELAPPPTPIR
jgi:hypothetical protein